MATQTNDLYKTQLEQAGIIPTRQRLQIARVLLRELQHLSADQLLTRVNADGGNVSKATIYNTLSLFVRKGVAREVVVDPNRIFYDSNTDPHYHLYHEDTGVLTDIYADCLLPSALPELPEGTELSGIDVIIRIRQRR